MCIAILQRKGSPLLEEHLDNAWQRNPDGGGFAYVNDEAEVVTFRSMDKEEWKREYLAAYEKYGEESTFLVHCRIATHGSVCVANAHPHTLDEGRTAFIHNGIISSVRVPKEGDMSDTRVFGEHILEHLPGGWLDDRVLVELVEGYIGYSKLVFLTVDPAYKFEWYILNESLGKWGKENQYAGFREPTVDYSDIWFSNDSYLSPTNYTYHKGKTGVVKTYAGWGDEWDKDNGGEKSLPPPVVISEHSDGSDTGAMSQVECEACEACGEVGVGLFGLCRECHTCSYCDTHVLDCGCFAVEAQCQRMEEDAPSCSSAELVISRSSAYGKGLASMTDAEFAEFEALTAGR